MPYCSRSVICCFAPYPDKLNRLLYRLDFYALLRLQYTAKYEPGCSPCMHCSWHSDDAVYTFICMTGLMCHSFACLK